MRAKVELHQDVVWFVRRCNEEERRLFHEKLDVLRGDPIGNSQHVYDPALSRYMLRWFEFGSNKAIFQFDPSKDRVYVLTCEKLKPLP